MSTRKVLTAATALTAALSLTALPASAATTTTTTTPSVATATAALKNAQANLDRVLDAFAPSAAWRDEYNLDVSELSIAQAAVTKALAAATPATPVVWHEIGSQTVVSNYERGIGVPNVSSPGYYTGQLKATVTLNLPIPKSPSGGADNTPAEIVWGVGCNALYGVGVGGDHGIFVVSGTGGSAMMTIPAHMKDCESSADFLNAKGTFLATDATKTWTATLTLYTSGKLVLPA